MNRKTVVLCLVDSGTGVERGGGNSFTRVYRLTDVGELFTTDMLFQICFKTSRVRTIKTPH